MHNAWLDSRRTDSPVALLCLPYAGAGTTAFRAWSRCPSPVLAPWPVRLPGRESRYHEPPFTSVDPLVRAMLAELMPEVAGPYAIFGHSFGALVAYELVRGIAATQLPMPELLCVSAHRAPHLRATNPRIHDMSDDEIVYIFGQLGGPAARALQRRDLVKTFLATLRADCMAAERYEHVAGDPLPVDLLVLGGEEDPLVPRSELEPWSAHTSGRFDLQLFDGGHFFIHEHPADVLDLVSARLQAVDEGSGCRT